LGAARAAAGVRRSRVVAVTAGFEHRFSFGEMADGHDVEGKLEKMQNNPLHCRGLPSFGSKHKPGSLPQVALARVYPWNNQEKNYLGCNFPRRAHFGL
jgi:hypothetical protein